MDISDQFWLTENFPDAPACLKRWAKHTGDIIQEASKTSVTKRIPIALTGKKKKKKEQPPRSFISLADPHVVYNLSSYKSINLSMLNKMFLSPAQRMAVVKSNQILKMLKEQNKKQYWKSCNARI